MSYPIPPWATDPMHFADDPRLGAQARLLLIALTRYANDEGIAWPGIRRLADDTGMAKDTIERAIHALDVAGRVEVERLSGKSNRYRLLNKQTGSVPLSDPHESGSSVLDGRTPRRGRGAADEGERDSESLRAA